MIGELKEELLKEPESIRSLLESFGFEHINIRGNNIRFARNSDGGQNISINLNDKYINVRDYVRGESLDIISYIIKEKNTNFKCVLSEIKRILNLSNDWKPQTKRMIFGGAYSQIIHKENSQQKIYDDGVLDSYLKYPNEKFRKDKIDLQTQIEWGIGYDVESDRITIPIRNEFGQLIGIKGRRNYETDDKYDPKYLYLIPCRMSGTLFGYSENYSNMYGETVMIFESEKSVLQMSSYGYKNAVAIGSNSLSEQQAKLILQLNPKHIIFMLDNELPIEVTKRNIEVLKRSCVMRNLKISYFDWEDCLDLGSKSSPSDDGKEVLDYILKNHIIDVGDDTWKNYGI